MIAMRPIREYDVIDLLNNGRFEGEVEGYVVMDGPKYLGHMLYRCLLYTSKPQQVRFC